MSVLIKGMEMPVTCCHCAFMYFDPDATNSNNGNPGSYLCSFTKEEIWNSQRDPNCPLVPVQPHGRLIDADALADVFRSFIAMYNSCPFSQLAPTDKARRDELQTALAEVINTPTIIPAEEGET